MTTTFEVDYERLVSEEEYEPDTKEFTDKEAAIRFAEKHCRPISYKIEDETDGFKEIDFGFVSDRGDLISEKKRK